MFHVSKHIKSVDKYSLLNPNGTVLIHYPEEDPLPEKIGNLVLTDQRVYGRSLVNFYKKEGTNQEVQQ